MITVEFFYKIPHLNRMRTISFEQSLNNSLGEEVNVDCKDRKDGFLQPSSINLDYHNNSTQIFNKQILKQTG